MIENVHVYLLRDTLLLLHSMLYGQLTLTLCRQQMTRQITDYYDLKLR